VNPNLCILLAAAPFVAVPAGQAQRRLGNRLEQGQGNGAAARTAVAVPARVHADEGHLDVSEGSASTGGEQRIHLTQGEHRLPVSGIGWIRAVPGLLRPAVRLEAGELLASEAMLLLQGSPQRRKPVGERIVRGVGGGGT
jgi:hypothetical protein